VAAASALLAPATAGAGQGSAIDQYVEGVPGAGGDTSSHDLAGGNGNGQGGEPLPAAAQQSLQQLGQAGQETAALATQTGPTNPAGGANQDGADRGAGGPSGKTGGDADTGGDKGVFAVALRLFDPAPEGMGLFLPVIVVGTLVVALAFALRRQIRKPGAVS
jgi:hypothetical protein